MTKPRMFFAKKILFAFLTAGMLVVSAAGKPSAQLEPTPHMSTIARATAFLLTNHHFSQQKLDEDLSEQLFQDYFKTLDPAHIFFTQQDLAAFDSVKKDLGNQFARAMSRLPLMFSNCFSPDWMIMRSLPRIISRPGRP